MDITDWNYQDSFGYIYMTWIYNTNSSFHGKLYIGQRLSRKDHELKAGDVYYGSGRKIQSYIKKHGKEGLNRIVIDIADNQEELNELEAYHVSQVLDDPNYLNLINGGKQKGMSNETRQKISKASIGRPKNFSEQSLANIGKATIQRLKGTKRCHESIKKGVQTRLANGSYKQTDNQKLKISQALVGRPNTWQKGKKRSEKTITLMRQNNAHKSGTKGKKWYNNGYINRCAYTCPEGFKEGVLISEKERKRRSETLRRIRNEN